jgi:hypothetical protein
VRPGGAESANAAEGETETALARSGRISWAQLLKRVFDIAALASARG